MERQFDPCVSQEDCPLAPNCFEDIDHTYGPANIYKTSLEREFRRQHITIRCRNKHNERHATEPFPEKPDRETMLRALGGLGWKSM